MKLSTILFESKNLTQFNFQQMGKSEVAQLLANTADESPSLLSAYDFDGYDAFDFQDKIEKIEYQGFKKTFKPFEGRFHCYDITIENSNGDKMIHEITIHIGQKSLYAEIYDGEVASSPKIEAKKLISSALDLLNKANDTLTDEEAKSIEDLIEKAYSVLDSSGQISHDVHNALENILDDLSDEFDIDDLIDKVEQVLGEI